VRYLWGTHFASSLELSVLRSDLHFRRLALSTASHEGIIRYRKTNAEKQGESQALSHGSCCAKVESRNADSRHVSPSDCRYNSRTINRTTGHVAMIINCIFCFFTIHIIVSNIFTQALSLRIGVQDILQLCIVLHNKYIDPLPSKGVEYSKTCNSFLQSIWFCFWEHLR
jgi:hypothetical protein